MSNNAPEPVPAVIRQLTNNRWNVPVLARLHPDHRVPFGALAEDLHASRDGLQRALTALESPGWIQREAGRRGAFLLTPTGRDVAAPCAPLVSAADLADIADLAFRKWTLPIVATLTGWTLGFAELRALLPDISPRALTLALKDMQQAGLVHREVVGGFPPRTEYTLLPAAAPLVAPLAVLAQEH